MWKTAEGSTERLLQLCTGYFLLYIVTGLVVKAFTGSPVTPLGTPRMNDIAFLGYNTLGANLTCLIPAVVLGWWRMKSVRPIRVGGVEVPSELLYIIPSGICTAVVIPTTTLMYTLPISVMVAMVIMRASVIVIGRAVDGIQIAQGILQRRIYWEENAAVVFAVLAACIELFGPHTGGFAFLRNRAAVVIFSSYITSYAIRIYIMNYYKNTRPKGAPLDNRAFFAVEQIAASVAMVLMALAVFHGPKVFPSWADVRQVSDFIGSIQTPAPGWLWASLSGISFGLVAFFSVFIFMFKGRTATFTGLINRLTSLVAGTAATLLGHWFFGSRFPSLQNWISLGFVLVAVFFLARAEKRRAAELKREKEI
ncbi:hypothetical protein [Mesoterricola sediminis]|uniref:Uncharacterized protein n=1 Tax=Mesoterricola sediminis TaxID=2927980 RepID=A0AA48KG73_9BACT|nr:hypothetical protein [Mesoterricola sediminis]BDU77153.1 hypothetical protein METESE_21110 [Mesoterricola sediminis]